MQFSIKRDHLLKSLNFVQGVVEKNTLPILSNVLIEAKAGKLIIITDLDMIFYDEIDEIKIKNEGKTTTSAAVLYDILRKISSDSEIIFDLKSDNKINLKTDSSDFNLLYQQKTFLLLMIIENNEIKLNNKEFLSLYKQSKNFYFE